MNEALICLNNTELSAAATAQALALKESALDAAALIGRVSNAEENALAVGAQSQLADFRRQVEKARVEAKAPALEFGKRIDAAAKALVTEVAAEELRISALAGDWASLEEAKRIAAEKLARLEAERIEVARIAEERRILREQAERELKARQEADALASKARAEAAEAEKAIREATNAKARAAAEAIAAKQREENERAAIELQRQKEIADAKTHEQLDDAQARASNAQAAVGVAPVAQAKAAGQTFKSDIEILAVDLPTLYRFHPNCVKLEALHGEIKAIINGGGTVKGVTFRQVTKSQVRSARELRAIEV